jgi:beta-ureidopropionase / N-carbamoyl-L-amino-acid hydrolase
MRYTANADRLWQSLMEMASVGPGAAGGSRRVALTDEDRQGRDLFVRWITEAGCDVTIDSIGNIFGRRRGRNPELASVVSGSHLDTQPTGGKFDGVFGVLAALEVIRTLNDHGLETDRAVEVAVWTNEEGSRFQPAMMGSGTFTGKFALEESYAAADREAVTVRDALTRIGYRGNAPTVPRPIHAYVEAHIEQGPILEREHKTIGVVSGIQAVKWLRVRVTGVNAHGGTTPMDVRRDPLVGASRMVEGVDRLSRSMPECVGTVGEFKVAPGSINVINQEVRFSIHLRCPTAELLADLDGKIRSACQDVAKASQLGVEFEPVWYSQPTKFDQRVIDIIARAAAGFGYAYREIASAAGHDAKYLAEICPTGMVFIPCENGISHNEDEKATRNDVAAGANVLLNSVLELANEKSD